MIRVVVDNAGSLTTKEAEALGHMFMHLAGHTLHPAQMGAQERFEKTGEIRLKASDLFQAEVGQEFTDENRILNEWQAPDQNDDVTKEYVDASATIIPPPPPSYETAPNTMSVEVFEGHVESEPSEVDAHGIPWDSRIHAKNKSRTANGVWKLGRNISPSFAKEVLAELRSKYCTTTHFPIPPAITPPAPVPPPPVSAPVAIVPPPPAPTPLPQTPVAAIDPYETLLNRVTTGMSNKTLPIAAVNNILRGFKDANGIPLAANLAAVGTLPDAVKYELIPRILEALDEVSAA